MRLASSTIGLAAVIVLLTLSNDYAEFNVLVERAQPFLLMFLAKLLLSFVIIGQAIMYRLDHYIYTNWLKVWTWLDPLTILILVMFAANGLYFFFLYGGFSGRFVASPDLYQFARRLIWFDAYIVIVVAIELCYQLVLEYRDHHRNRK